MPGEKGERAHSRVTQATRVALGVTHREVSIFTRLRGEGDTGAQEQKRALGTVCRKIESAGDIPNP
jgi:hypothetical protein